jgi:hypothetical protein
VIQFTISKEKFKRKKCRNAQSRRGRSRVLVSWPEGMLGENLQKKWPQEKRLPARPIAAGALLHDANNLNRSCSHLFV